ncbi:MAG: DNA polymerase III subunit gamma/tau [Pseudomonadota bacterium]
MQDSPAYMVLARKYRPGHFRDLIGQEAMVRTLTNAFAHDRIAHAFMLTGVRGVGKTTTARIIAKGLNCTGRGDGPTIDPCGDCSACLSIADGRNVDVIEMDAASNTGVDDIREIIDGVRYRAAEARYKVYIIDEIHMLSKNAFNALLKTLEEPPEHVKFIFATTEIRKVPVTVLSRCQRFDLRRIEPEAMIDHLARVTEKEGAAVDREALALITRAAEGSVRDALSLLDQAIAHGTGGTVGAAEMRAMLGLADRGRVFDLFEAVMRGDAAAALAELGGQYADGADPAVVLRDLAELTHWISVLRISNSAAEDPTISAGERARGQDLARRLEMRVLTRAWQMLLKALDEVATAPTPMMAAEMAVIRLTHVADLPTPGELVRRLEDGARSSPPAPPAPARTREPAPQAAASSPPVRDPLPSGPPPTASPSAPRLQAIQGGAAAAVQQVAEPIAAMPAAGSDSFADAVAIIADAKDMLLLHQVERFVRPVRCRAGSLEFNPAPGAPADLAGRLSAALAGISGTRWSVIVSDAPGGPTIAEEKAKAEGVLRAEIEDHPLVLAAMAAFPGARIAAVRPLTPEMPEPEPAAFDPDTTLVDIDGDLIDGEDPFEEDL